MMVTLLIVSPRLRRVALTSIHTILGVRTAQGAISWAILLNAFPYVAVPAYCVFGQSHFEPTP
jgi:cardiolipin synthase A/B